MSNRPTKQDALDAWSAAATIDSMGDWLEKYTEDIRIVAWREGYNQGRREGEEAQQDHPQGNPEATSESG